MGIQISLERYDVQILGRQFQIEGQMEPVGRLLDYFNSEGRSTFPVFDVKVLPIMPAGPLKVMARPEIIVSHTELGLIYFLDSEFRQRVQLLRNSDGVIAYTPHAVLRGNFHRGVETRLGELFNLMPGSYLAMSETSIFPTTELPTPFPQRADLLLVNRHYVNLYHVE
jgi:hypothetical protein